MRVLTVCLFGLTGLASEICAQDQEPEPRRDVVKSFEPTYPTLAARMHVSGTVRVAVVIQPNGRVAKAHALSGHPLLEEAAEQAARRWRFTPSSTWSSNVVQIRFSLDPKGH